MHIRTLNTARYWTKDTEMSEFPSFNWDTMKHDKFIQFAKDVWIQLTIKRIRILPRNLWEHDIQAHRVFKQIK